MIFLIEPKGTRIGNLPKGKNSRSVFANVQTTKGSSSGRGCDRRCRKKGQKTKPRIWGVTHGSNQNKMSLTIPWNDKTHDPNRSHDAQHIDTPNPIDIFERLTDQDNTFSTLLQRCDVHVVPILYTLDEPIITKRQISHCTSFVQTLVSPV